MGNKLKSLPRDGNSKAGIESGTCHKEKVGDVGGMGSVGKGEKPEANPSIPVSRGHTIK